MKAEIEQGAALLRKLESAVLSTFVGEARVVQLALIGLAGSLHVLIEDIPGVGKTTLALALARLSGLSFSRIQCTPDLLPADVLGLSVWDSQKRDFVFKPGPVLANFVLADELNRSSPRTQAAFLQAMQEGAISVDGKIIPLPQPFFMIATQNPQNFVGTFPLPEAELDRFGLCFSLGYPDPDAEQLILERNDLANPVDALEPITNPEAIVQLRHLVRRIGIHESVRRYICEIIRATRTMAEIRLGASPRAGIFLQQASRAAALYAGRDFVIPEDVVSVAVPVLAHRLVLGAQSRLSGKHSAELIDSVLRAVRKPTGL
ncbi:MAG: MoxR family ATPase [Termitinemataceae bacterium]